MDLFLLPISVQIEKRASLNFLTLKGTVKKKKISLFLKEYRLKMNKKS